PQGEGVYERSGCRAEALDARVAPGGGGPRGCVQVAVGPEFQPDWAWRRRVGGEDVDKRSRLPVVAKDLGAAVTGDVEGAVGAEGQVPRTVQAPAAGRDKCADELSGRVVAEDRVRVGAGDVKVAVRTEDGASRPGQAAAAGGNEVVEELQGVAA